MKNYTKNKRRMYKNIWIEQELKIIRQQCNKKKIKDVFR